MSEVLVQLTDEGKKELAPATVDGIELFIKHLDQKMKARLTPDGWLVEGFFLPMKKEDFKRRFKVCND